MQNPIEVLDIFGKYTPLVDNEIRGLLDEQTNLLMYDMMRYFFGYLDENLKPITGFGGKRFRPGIALLLADFYGTLDKTVEIASAIEIFHNFTLIHDDIEDRDLLRRGRPTVWNKWGINHGINTGDAQLILVSLEFDRFARKNPDIAAQVNALTNKRYLTIAEGQYLDFHLSELPINHPEVNEESNLDLIGRKSGVLVGLPAEVAGIVAGKSDEECRMLWEYGYNLGLAYQLSDDLVSIWGNADASGKSELADIKEKKKTLPVIHLYEVSADDERQVLETLYNKSNDLSAEEMAKVKQLLDASDSYDFVWAKIQSCLTIVETSIDKLSITDEQKIILKNINNALITDPRKDKV